MWHGSLDVLWTVVLDKITGLLQNEETWPRNHSEDRAPPSKLREQEALNPLKVSMQPRVGVGVAWPGTWSPHLQAGLLSVKCVSNSLQGCKYYKQRNVFPPSATLNKFSTNRLPFLSGP